MTWTEYLIILLCVSATMLVFRVVPCFVLKGKELPEAADRALNLIPPAAFAALIANDLLGPGMFAEGLVPGLIPLIAAVLTLIVGFWRKSLVWCIVVGVVSYGLMLFLL